MGSKTVKQCVQFYYLWKKVCAEEYKRLRIIRRKREQEELYNLRSKAAEAEKRATPSPEPNADVSGHCLAVRSKKPHLMLIFKTQIVCINVVN